MVKITGSETLSLDKSDQKKVSGQVKKLKKKIQEGLVLIRKDQQSKNLIAQQNRGLVYIAHIPHGFYENEIKNYFKQFGLVTNIKLCRSKRSGISKGYGYVEFAHSEVAKIAAETMNNYLMFKKRITAEYVPFEKRPKGLFFGKGSTPTRYSSKVRREKQVLANNSISNKTYVERTLSRLTNLNKKLHKINNAGIDCEFKPTEAPRDVKQEKNSDSEEVASKHEADPYASKIEIKVPIKKSQKSVKSLASKTFSKKSNSAKLKLPHNTSSNNVLLTKSLDSVKAILSSKKPNKEANLSISNSPQQINKSTLVNIKNNKKSKKNKKGKTKRLAKKTKELPPLNADTVKKIARELIRKRGNTLLNVITTTKPNISKNKSARK